MREDGAKLLSQGDDEDPKSRHKGKLDTESLLRQSRLPFTSIRPTYIYGPGNYNPLEEYFFTRLDAGRSVCIPGHGEWRMLYILVGPIAGSRLVPESNNL